MKFLLELLKVSRPGFWPTQLWFYLLPFAERDMFGRWEFWLGCVYVCFPLSLLLYGWNDIGDAETDRLNPRKDSWLFGARPNESMRRRLPWAIVAVQLPFLPFFVWVAGEKMLLLGLAFVAANLCYNTFAFKRLPVLDLLNQSGYVLIFVLASWLCDVPQLNGPAIAFGALFAMQSHMFGQIMDVEEDREAGRRSTAVRIGVVPSKVLLIVIMAANALLAFHFFRGWYVAAFMAGGALFFAADALRGPRRYSVWFCKVFFIAWNIVVFVTMHLVWRYGVFLLG